MTEQDARRLAAQIDGEPGWHAELRRNEWLGAYHVFAWREADVAPDLGTIDVEGYHFEAPHLWYRTRELLRKEGAGLCLEPGCINDATWAGTFCDAHAPVICSLREDPFRGYCLNCDAHRRRSQAREVQPAGYPLSAAVYVCAACGELLDELPF